MDFQDAPIITAKSDDGYKVSLIGPVHTNNAWIAREFDKVAAEKPKVVDLDLEKCDFLSSSGIGEIMSFYNKVRAGGGSVKISKIQKPVLSSLKFSRLDTLFSITPEAVIPAKH